jgi:hypothetical protein
MYKLQDFIVITNIYDSGYTFDIYFLHKITKQIWLGRHVESHMGKPIFYNFSAIESLIDYMNCNENIDDFQVIFRNIDRGGHNILEVTFNSKSYDLDNYTIGLHEYPTIICKNCIKDFSSNDIIIDSKNYTFCKECYDEGLCFQCLSVDFNNDTIYTCDVCNKQVCSQCLLSNNTIEYCKDCFAKI